MSEFCQAPEFWIDLVETSLDLDWTEAFVPRDGLPVETAMALAERLSMEVDIDASEYVFYRIEASSLKRRSNQVVH